MYMSSSITSISFAIYCCTNMIFPIKVECNMKFVN